MNSATTKKIRLLRSAIRAYGRAMAANELRGMYRLEDQYGLEDHLRRCEKRVAKRLKEIEIDLADAEDRDNLNPNDGDFSVGGD